MKKVVAGEPYCYQCGGEELARVLNYYGYIPDVASNRAMIICPFHKDINPSMTVDFLEGRFYCFGCDLAGDAFHFVELMNPRLNSLKAMMLFQRILHSKKVRELNFNDRIKESKYDSVLYDISWDYYYGLSKVDWQLDATPEVKACRKYMLQRGFTPDTLNQCLAKVTYNKSYPIIFPMLDNGMFKGWVCRTTDPEVEKKRKYLYNKGFNRSDTLVGEYKGCEYVYVVEGYMDRLKFIQAGIKNVVAVLGWKMSRQQEEKLKREGIRHVISALDNDRAGVKGTKYLRTIFQVTRFLYPWDKKDIGEMSKAEIHSAVRKTMERFRKES